MTRSRTLPQHRGPCSGRWIHVSNIVYQTSFMYRTFLSDFFYVSDFCVCDLFMNCGRYELWSFVKYDLNYIYVVFVDCGCKYTEASQPRREGKHEKY
jgi:hypothetical protein